MPKHSITIQISHDTLNKLQEVISIHNFRQKQDTGITVEDIIKAALYRYLNRLQDKSIVNWSKEIITLLPLDTDLPLKNRIKEYLKEIGISQSDLAQRSKLPVSTISSILNNQHQPSIDHFLRIYYALDCPPLNEILYREV